MRVLQLPDCGCVEIKKYINIMKIKNFYLVLCSLILFTPFAAHGCSKENKTSGLPEENKIKEAQFAGKFYPADAVKLKNSLSYFFNKAVKPINDKPYAIVAPHAGYIFSGQIAADAYNCAKGFKYDYILILGTNHTTADFSKVSVYSQSGYKTPLGTAQIAHDFIDKLLKENKDIEVNEQVNDKEHSVEVQIPFIQYAFPGVSIVPIIIGSSDLNLCQRLGNTIEKVFRNKSILIVASSDLSHYPGFENALKADKQTLHAIKGMDASDIINKLNDKKINSLPSVATCACGEGPILCAVSAAKAFGASTGTIVSYANSGHSVFGDFNKVVGYGAVVFTKAATGAPWNSDTFFEKAYSDYDAGNELLPETKKYLLGLARETVEQYLKSEVTPLARNAGEEVKLKRGAFVTLKKNNELRGCIGRMDSELPLFKVIEKMAIEAAFNDNRFEQVSLKEMNKIEFEISVLTPFKKVPNADYIRLKIDGVLIKKSGRQAVFLPQVAEETGWSKEKFLDQLCYKAGLSAGDWKTAEIYTFQADVFKESDFH